jgi:branched-chain amino acid transport system ATP-binding protein
VEAMFEIRDLKSGYGGVTVLKGLNLVVGHEVLAVLGANGAGKTTLLATMARHIPLTAGELRFDGKDISHLPAWMAARLGVGYVPQEHGIFGDLTVRENLEIGGMFSRGEVGDRIDEVMTLFPDLKERQDQRAGTLSGGEARMVACSRALMQQPLVLLLDEPTAGLSPLYVDGFFEKVREIHEKRKVAIVLAEQNATKALEIADRVMLLNLGESLGVADAADVTPEMIKEGYGI